MTSVQKYFISLAIIVIGFYLGLTYIPQLVGTCMDGACGFSTGEIVISFAIPLAFIVLPVGLEMALFRKGLSQSLSAIGITRFRWQGIRIATIYLLPLLLFFPVVSLLTSSPVSVQPNWGWLIVNILLVNGFAEEIMMRGFVFRHLREGRPFWRAAALSTVFFAVYHTPLIVTHGVVLGVIAIVMAVPLGLITAYSYERGENTIWGPALLHAVNNALVMLLFFPADIQPAVGTLYMVTGIVMSILILVIAYRSGYGRTATRRTTVPVVVGA